MIPRSPCQIASYLIAFPSFNPLGLSQEVDRLVCGFQTGDTDGDSSLSTAELNAIPILKNKLNDADSNGDGSITFVEFRACPCFTG